MWPYRAWQYRIPLEEAANNTVQDINLLVAIMDRESYCGLLLKPPGPRGTGDNGHGRGLMQIDDRFHPDFCADIEVWGDPFQNTLYGATLLRTYIRSIGTDVQGIAAYNAGPNRVVKSGYTLVEDLDTLTEGGNYVSDVLKRMAMFTNLGVR